MPWNRYEILYVRNQKSRGESPWNHPLKSLFLVLMNQLNCDWNYGIWDRLEVVSDKGIGGIENGRCCGWWSGETVKAAEQSSFFMFGYSFLVLFGAILRFKSRMVRLPWYRVGLLLLNLCALVQGEIGCEDVVIWVALPQFWLAYHNSGWIPVLRFCIYSRFA